MAFDVPPQWVFLPYYANIPEQTELRKMHTFLVDHKNGTNLNK